MNGYFILRHGKSADIGIAIHADRIVALPAHHIVCVVLVNHIAISRGSGDGHLRAGDAGAGRIDHVAVITGNNLNFVVAALAALPDGTVATAPASCLAVRNIVAQICGLTVNQTIIDYLYFYISSSRGVCIIELASNINLAVACQRAICFEISIGVYINISVDYQLAFNRQVVGNIKSCSVFNDQLFRRRNCINSINSSISINGHNSRAAFIRKLNSTINRILADFLCAADYERRAIADIRRAFEVVRAHSNCAASNIDGTFSAYAGHRELVAHAKLDV
ncbi:MAG TPA: hypothetical protein IAC81_02685 [Candidatus Scatomorpha stercorigallinarum]|nr:hypothetical protein [Candidatus Scatomorpha stercorigallinarum]